MAKIHGLFGAMTGKLADTVMAVRGGEQIVRKYQPVVSNPSTINQVGSRAKLKLMSQLSAVMAPVIAIPKAGNVSSRNNFVKKNYRLATYADNTASVDLNGIQLTSSVVALPAIQVGRTQEDIIAYLAGVANLGAVDVSRVVYCMFVKQADNKLRFVESKVATTSVDGSWSVNGFPLVNEEVVMLAYGVRDNTEAARVAFGNMEAISAQQVAQLITTRSLTEADVTLTETRGFTLPRPAGRADEAPEEEEKGASRKKVKSDDLSE